MRGVAACASAAMLAACTPSHQDNAQLADWQQWHHARRDTDLAVGRALNGGGLPDYPAAIAAIGASDRPRGVKDQEIGSLILASFEEPGAVRRPAQSLDDGLVLLERAAQDGGESSRIAPEYLRLTFQRGLSARSRVVLAPDPMLAACWTRVRAAREKPAICIEARRVKGR